MARDKSRIADGRQQVGLILDEDMVRKLDEIGKRDGRTRAQVMAMFIENGLAGDEQFAKVIASKDDCLRIASMTSFTETDYYGQIDPMETDDFYGPESDDDMDHVEALVYAGFGEITLEQLHLIRKEADFYYERHLRKYHRTERRQEQMRLNAQRKAEDDLPLPVKDDEK